MSTTAAKFNLRPQERRLVVVVGIVVFVVLNIWLVWPHFGDWGMMQMRSERAQKSLDTYRAEIGKVPSYRVRLNELESAGSSVVPDEQELDLIRIVDAQARNNRLTVIQADPRPRVTLNTQTNRFFEEQYEMLHVNTANEDLINFLVSLTSTNSMIRVKDLTLKPDTSGMRLDGQLTLVASYQRSAPIRGSTPATSATTPIRAASPATAPTAVPGAVSSAAAQPPKTTAARTNKSSGTVVIPGPTNKITIPTRNRATNSPAKKP